MTDTRTNALAIVLESLTEEERDVNFLPKDTVFEDHNCRALGEGQECLEFSRLVRKAAMPVEMP